MKKYLLPAAAMTAFVAGMAVVPNTFATAENCTADADTTIASLLAGECSTITVNGTLTEEVTINRPITIKGDSGAKLIGTITIADGATDVTLDGLTINSTASSAELVQIKTKTDLKVLSSNIYTGNSLEEASIFDQGNTAGIVSYYGADNSQGSGSTISITNSNIAAKYAVWIESDNTTLNISGSKLTGYAALDLTSSEAESPVAGNKITINNSVLTGQASPVAAPTNSYGTIVIGNQNGTSIDIVNGSVITNAFGDSNAREDLILIQATQKDGAPTATNTSINVTNSTMNNTAKTDDLGVIYNYNESKDNNFVATNSNLVGPAFADQYSVTFDVDGNKTVVSVNEGGTLSSADIPAAAKDGYEFAGWFTDPDFTSPFNAESPISADVTVYAKFVALSTDVTSEEEDSENPNTADAIALYVGIAVIALLGLGATVFAARKLSR